MLRLKARSSQLGLSSSLDAREAPAKCSTAIPDMHVQQHQKVYYHRHRNLAENKRSDCVSQIALAVVVGGLRWASVMVMLIARACRYPKLLGILAQGV